MRISQNWLQEYVEAPAPEQLNHIFEMAGIGVENFDVESGVWTLEITSNRGDWLSATGLAREIAAMTNQRFRLALEVGSTPDLEGIAVAIENPDDCARYAAKMIENVEVKDSPAWIQQRLIECGMRPVNNIVDATNLVMLETGQPLHAFDADKIEGGQINVRRAKNGEKIVTLDETERELTDEILVIADANSPIAVAGVMGGRDSEVTNSTTRVLLESAHFAPARVRRGARILDLTSEASRRFARWVDPNGVPRAANRAGELIAEVSGGTVLPGMTDVYPAPVGETRVSLRVARANAVLGIELSSDTMAELLKRLGLKVESQSKEILQIAVPTWRRDIEREIDVIEEIARLNGYEKIPTTLPKTVNAAAGRSLSQRLEERARGVLLRCGLNELMTYSLENAASVARAGLTGNDGLSTPAVTLRNPLSDDYTQLRTSLIPSLLEVLKTNANADAPVRIFEIGKVYLPVSGKTPGESTPPDERLRIGIALLAAPPEAHWQKQNATAIDFFSLKGIVERIFNGLGAPTAIFRATQNPPFHPGRCAAASLNGEDVGMLGEIHPDIAQRYELRHRAYIALIDFDALVRHISIMPKFAPFSKTPPADRDIALVVPEKTNAAAIESTVRAGAGVLLESARVFDVYQGENIAKGFKSVAVALRFRAADRTLQDSEIEEAMSNVREAAAAKLGAELRA
jgi:phenylalanyl-tRNA synthetase beta chain